MKTALVYDHINKFGGAERILLALHELFPDAPLYTAVYDKEKAPWASVFTIKTSFMERIFSAKRFHERFPLVPIFAFEQFNFSEYDLVISISSAEAKGIITSPSTLHINYCLTPTRFLWSHSEEYFSNSIFKTIAQPFISFARMWDIIASRRPDYYISISKNVQKRLKHYYHQESDVIYPPVDTDKFKPQADLCKEEFFLVVSRLVKYKRIDYVIEAFNKLKKRLVIIGTGLHEESLKKIAGSTIEFKGELTEDGVISYYQTCAAVIFPQEEDFGLVPVEALACGKPVIAYGRGGATEVITSDVGVLFSEQLASCLVDEINKFDKKQYNSDLCRKASERFSTERFKKQFYSAVVEKCAQFKKERL